MAVWLFWASVVGIVFAYAGVPLLFAILARVRPRPLLSRMLSDAELPGVTMIVPVHDEAAVIGGKLSNTASLDYPEGRLQVLFVSDASTDGTNEAIAACASERISLILLDQRGGKAAGLNAGLARAAHDLIVFSDASILFESNAIREIARPFQHTEVGCVSGEDWIPEGGGESLYGRYELYLRRQESLFGSIVGASGSFYAQRKPLCDQFIPHVAPDFLSVLNTVRRGHRAVTCPAARGRMTALNAPTREFERKVRTVLRGITTLARNVDMLNPVRFGSFAIVLLSHKLARWLVPFFLISLLAASLALAGQHPFFLTAAVLQVVFYVLAAAGTFGPPAMQRALAPRIAAYFTGVNVATLFAWWKFVTGVRQEIWAPTKRESGR